MTDIYIGIKEDDSTAVSSPVPVSHTNLQDVGANTHVQIDGHIADTDLHFLKSTITKTDVGLDQVDNTADADKPIVAAQLTHNNDATKHFTQDQIDHMSILNIGNVDHGGIDLHIGNTDLHFIIDDAAPGLNKVWSSTKTQTEINAITGTTDHTLLTNIGVRPHATIDTELSAAASHASDASIHFAAGTISHTALQDIGTNSHAAIDTHLADTDTHFLASTITPATLGLGDVDNVADVDKPVSTATTAAIDVVDAKVTANLALANTHRVDASIHYQLNDTATQTTTAWSSQKIQTELDGIDVSGIAKLDSLKAYSAGDLVINNGNIYEANGPIAIGAMFNIGTTGSTWSALLSGDAVDLDADLTTVYAGVAGVSNPGASFVPISWSNAIVQNRPAELSINVAGDTITAVEGGLYNVDVVVSLNGLSATTNGALIQMTVNGVQQGEASPVPRIANGGNGIGVISAAIELPAGALVQVQIRTFSGITQIQSNGTHIKIQKASGVKGDAGDGIETWALPNAYPAGRLVLSGNNIYRANAAIPANTAFVVGTSGATWTSQIQVVPDADLATVYAGLTANVALLSSYVEVDWNETVLENRPLELKNNGTKITALVAGLYNFDAVIELTTGIVEARVLIDGVLIPNAWAIPRNGYGIASVTVQMSAGQELSLQIRRAGAAVTMNQLGTHIRVQRASAIKGDKGDQGDAGAGGVTQAALDVVQADVDANQVATDNHNNSSSIHFTQNLIDHTVLQNRGTNSHADIDNHIANAQVHFTKSSLTKDDVGLGDVDNTSDAGKPVSDAQALLNTAQLAASALVQTDVDANQVTTDAHAADTAIHYAIDDATTVLDKVWSSQKTASFVLPFSYYREYFRYPAPSIGSANQLRIPYVSNFVIPEAGKYEFLLSYSYTVDSTTGDIVMRLRAAGFGLGTQGSDEFFYLRRQQVDSGGAPRITSIPSLGNNQELYASFADVFDLPAGPLPVEFLAQGGSLPAGTRSGVWDFYLKVERVG